MLRRGAAPEEELQQPCKLATEQDVKRLPPLPAPKWDVEGCCGTALLLTMVAFAALTQVAAAQSAPWVLERRAYLGLVGVEVTVALACLVGIRCRDPGVIARSPETCFPLPDKVAELLRAGQDVSGLRNIRSSEGCRTFCVRCLVWRPEGSSHADSDDDDSGSDSDEEEGEVHHCSICQRCVVHYDHHCHILGRCIAGKGCSGTRALFRLGLATGLAGCAALHFCPSPAQSFVPDLVQRRGPPLCCILWIAMFGRYAVAEQRQHGLWHGAVSFARRWRRMFLAARIDFCGRGPGSVVAKM